MAFVTVDLAERVTPISQTAADASVVTDANLNDADTGTSAGGECRLNMVSYKITHDLGFAVANIDTMSIRVFDGTVMTAGDCEIFPYQSDDANVNTGNPVTLTIQDNGAYDTVVLSSGFIGDLEDVGTNQISIRVTSAATSSVRFIANEIEIEFTEASAGDITDPNEANHTQQSDNATISQTHLLTVGEANHTQQSDAFTLGLFLLVAEANHTQQSDAPVLAQTEMTVPDEANHTQQSDGATVSQTHILAVGEANHGQQSDGAVLDQTHTLTVGEANHTQQSDGAVLAQTHLLTVGEANHTQQSDNATFGAAVSVSVDEANHTQQSDGSAFTQTHVLTVDEANHTQQSDASTFTTTHILVPADVTQGISSDVAAFVQTQVLITAEANHTQQSDGLTLAQSTATGNSLRIFGIAAPGSRQIGITARSNRNIAV